MTENSLTSPRPSLFAQKGEAEPAPAVAYVSLRQMQGKPDRRDAAPDRRAQWGDGQDNGKPSDSSPPQRRAFTASGTDHDGRRHFTPRSGLAMGQQYVPWTEPKYVPWTAPKDQADAPKQTAKARDATPSVSSLSALISRHRDGVSKPPSLAPESAPAPIAATNSPAPDHASTTRQQPTTPTTTGPTKIDMSYLSRADTGGRRPASSKPTADPDTPQVEQPPAIPKQKIIRRKVTMRLDVKQFNKIKSLSDKSGTSQQSLLAAAVADYLSKIV